MNSYYAINSATNQLSLVYVIYEPLLSGNQTVPSHSQKNVRPFLRGIIVPRL